LGNQLWHHRTISCKERQFVPTCWDPVTMTESDWLKAKDPEAMLRLVGGRLSPRRWHLLACALARRALDSLPSESFRDAVEWDDRNAGAAVGSPEAFEILARLEPALQAGTEAIRSDQRGIVLAADPDADPESFEHSDPSKTNPPPTVLFGGACRAARQAVDEA